MNAEQFNDEIGRAISNLRALSKITKAGSELITCAVTLERARNRITELAKALDSATDWIAQVTETNPSHALEMIEVEHKHDIVLGPSRAALAKVPA